MSGPVGYEFPVDFTDITARLKKNAERHFLRLLASRDLSVADARAEVQSGEVAAVIDKAIRNGKPDLLVMGTHGARGFQRWLMGSVTRRMLHHTSLPVLTVSAAGKAAITPFQRILVATDFSPGTLRALDYAISLAQMNKARVFVLHVLDEMRAIAWPEYRQERTREAERGLAKLLSEAGASGKANILVDAGTPYDVILNTVRKQRIDLVVMNTQGKGLLDRAILGSTSERVLTAATCPVLLIPPGLRDRGRKTRKH
jgi:nucleotide-binding universal stress UspA family protein